MLKDYKFFIAARLSAQCTDKMVNIVTKTLFSRYDSMNAFCVASIEDIKAIIRPCGLSNKKASDIINICKILKYKFSCKIPDNMKDLLTLPGIGRKTANLILAQCYLVPTIVVDTHFKRIVRRLGLTEEKKAEKIETDLEKLIPKSKCISFCHAIILFGREICGAKKTSCLSCEINFLCRKFNEHKI